MGARRSIIATCLAAAVAASLVGCTSDRSDDGSGTTTIAPAEPAATGSGASPTPPSQVPLLGVLNAESGTFEDGTLTLTGVDPSGVWFTDQPVREAGTAGLESFTDLFFSRTDTPNAALELTGTGDVAIVELSDPRVDTEAGTISFSATLISDADGGHVVEHPGLAAYLSRNVGNLPADFGANALFIDPGFTPVEVDTNGDDVAALASLLSSTIDGYDDFKNQVTVAYDDGNSIACQLKYIDEAAEVLANLYGQSAPAVRKMQEDEAANDGVLPASDAELFSTTQGDVDNAQTTLEQFQAELPRILDGNCD